jgi:hypothetical protein
MRRLKGNAFVIVGSDAIFVDKAEIIMKVGSDLHPNDSRISG